NAFPGHGATALIAVAAEGVVVPPLVTAQVSDRLGHGHRKESVTAGVVDPCRRLALTCLGEVPTGGGVAQCPGRGAVCRLSAGEGAGGHNDEELAVLGYLDVAHVGVEAAATGVV